MWRRLLNSSLGALNRAKSLQASTSVQQLATETAGWFLPATLCKQHIPSIGLSQMLSAGFAYRAFASSKRAGDTPGLRYWRHWTPGARWRVTIRREGIWKGKPKRSLVRGAKKMAGRNNQGRITCRHRGGGIKRRLRMVDFQRRPSEVPSVVERLEYDPGRTGYIALLRTPNPDVPSQPVWSYMLAPQELKPGDSVASGPGASVKPGNTLLLRDMPPGISIYNIELTPGKGGILCRAAGCTAQLLAKQDRHAQVRLPSGEVRLVSLMCSASVGVVSNPLNRNRVWGKAGWRRLRGIRPTVRGIAMNPVDHPHGGRTNGGRPSCSPWGMLAKGFRTRTKRKPSSKFIMTTRHEAKRGR